MSRQALSALLVGSLLLASPWRPAASPHSPLSRYESSRLSMACVYAIVAYGPDASTLPAIVETAFDEVDRIDRLMSHYKPESPLSRINREASQGPVTVEPELFDFIAEALRYGRESDGAFDITVGPLMKTWGFFRGEGRLPTDAELADVRGRLGYQHVILDSEQHTIHFDRPGIELDLGGIAKGYAVDRVLGLLKSRGVEAALISAGGSTIYALGAPPGEDGWEVSLQDPVDARKVAMTLRLKDRTLSVAGRAEKSFSVDGVTYSHIMNPRTARPVQGVLSVAVLTDTGTAGDALDDVLFVQGVEKSRAFLARLRELGPASGQEKTRVEAFFFLPAVSAASPKGAPAAGTPPRKARGTGTDASRRADAARAWTLLRLGGQVDDGVRPHARQ